QTSEKCVRHWIKTFLSRGFDALPDRHHLGQKSALTPAMEEAIRQRLRQENRTWTAAQLADWVAEQFGVRFAPDQLCRRLRRAKIHYKRTGRTGPRIQVFMASPTLTLVRFRRWDDVLRLPAPDKEWVRAIAIRHYARAVAQAALGKVEGAEQER